MGLERGWHARPEKFVNYVDCKIRHLDYISGIFNFL